MNTVEDAYNELARGIIDFIGGRSWDKAFCSCQIYHRMASTVYWLESFGNVDKKALAWPNSCIDSGKAAILIRDDVLQKNGQRIWGLIFTLYPDGKFNIEYDYSKPEDYEETDDIVGE
ncbi:MULTISPECIES: hypothetical protein [Gammaproteobacteria]|uniref:Uncharacterized protein n=1 Tax=Bowmanella yangjiangensis TaxID=2811230 RepID=A0ABS3CZB3_9ALTE|nr:MULTISPECIES: hypothetical protein [Gammaproteobacteria]MBN7822463.1 hypothetical protein [Bowmanella yangjiangensis]WFC60671.1 hypothetical protein EWH21_02755 [Pseudomonas sp. REST10]